MGCRNLAGLLPSLVSLGKGRGGEGRDMGCRVGSGDPPSRGLATGSRGDRVISRGLLLFSASTSICLAAQTDHAAGHVQVDRWPITGKSVPSHMCQC
jgi:hypothetical protein